MNASRPDGDRPRLGELAIEHRLVSPEDRDGALALQVELVRLELPVRIGKLFLLRNLMDRPTLFALLLAQSELAGFRAVRVDTNTELLDFSGADNEAVLARLLALGALKPGDRERAEGAARALGRRGVKKGLAEILIENRVVPRGTIERAVQEAIRQASPGSGLAEGRFAPDEESGLFVGLSRDAEPDILRAIRASGFGRIAVERGFVPAERMREALAVQAILRELGLPKRLEDLLPALGILTEAAAQRTRALRAQRLSEIPWTQAFDRPDDSSPGMVVARRVLELGLLSEERVQECLYIQNVMRESGLEEDLFYVMEGRGFLGPEEIARLRAGLPGASRDLPAGDPGGIAADTAEEIDESELDGGEEGGPVSEESSRLGELAVFNGLIDRERLDECLLLQQEMSGVGFSMRLGRIFVEKRYVDRAGVVALLRAQAEGRGAGSGETDLSVEVVKFTDAEEAAIRAWIEEPSLISPEDRGRCQTVRELLERWGISKTPGEILFEMGCLPEERARDILHRRDSTRCRLPPRSMEASSMDVMDEAIEDSPLYRRVREKAGMETLSKLRQYRLGRLAIHRGIVNKEKVRECLAIQLRLQEVGVFKRLGEILVARGYLGRADLAGLLDLQRVNRTRIDWVEMAGEETLDPQEARLAGFLRDNAILPGNQILECVYLRGTLARLGLREPLARVVADRGYMDPEVLDAIWLRLRESPPADERDRGLRSDVLREAYREILERVAERRRGGSSPSVAGAARSGVRRTRLTSPHPGARRPRVVLLAASLLVLFVAAGLFGVARWSGSHEREPATAGPGVPPGEVRAPFADEQRVTIAGRIVGLAQYPGPEGSLERTFDFFLERDGTYVHVRGTIREGNPLLDRLRFLESEGKPVAIKGLYHTGEGGPLVTLPDARHSRGFLEIESVTEE